MQLAFQDPYARSTLMSVLELVAEPLVAHGKAKNVAAARRWSLSSAGLPADFAERHLHAFGWPAPAHRYACALALHLDFIVADEPVSALDVGADSGGQPAPGLPARVRAGLPVHRPRPVGGAPHSHRIGILYCGKLVEVAESDAATSACGTPTPRRGRRAPIPDPPPSARPRIVLQGEIPNPINPLPGCRFKTRCLLVVDIRCTATPPLEEKAPGHWAACFVR